MSFEIKYIHTQDGSDLDGFYPEIEDNFWNLLSIGIGPEGKDSLHVYHVTIATPRALDHYIQNEGPMWGRHHIIVNDYNPKDLKKIIIDKINDCSRPLPEDTYLVLSRYFEWEFEDYKE